MPRATAPLPSRPSPEADEDTERLALIRSHDPYTTLRNRLGAMADAVDEYAGIPVPIEGEPLVCSPAYRFASVLGRQPAEDDGPKIRNSFWSSRYRCHLSIIDDERGRPAVAVHVGSAGTIDKLMHTLGCSDAWGVEQEANALQLLAGHLRHRQFKQYLLTGSFLESSPRSGVTYFFRKLRPTIALSCRSGPVRVLCALCLHSMAHYEDSWAGAMCPTDDVIAHLMLMRGDEPLFWKRANQIPPNRPEAGIAC